MECLILFYSIGPKLEGIPESLVGVQITGFTPGVSDLVGLGWVLRIYISSKFPGAAQAAGLGTALCEPLPFGTSVWGRCDLGGWKAGRSRATLPRVTMSGWQ